MTDKDAILFRSLVHKYGFDKIIVELVRMSGARIPFDSGSRWVKVRRALRGVHCLLVTPVEFENDDDDLDANESGKALHPRSEVQAPSGRVRTVPDGSKGVVRTSPSHPVRRS